MTNLKNIVATDHDGVLIITLEILEKNLAIEAAVMDACNEYCMTEEGRYTYCDVNCFNFNWGDFIAYVPNDICEKHGFKICDGEYINEMFVDFNQELVDEDYVMQYD